MDFRQQQSVVCKLLMDAYKDSDPYHPTADSSIECRAFLGRFGKSITIRNVCAIEPADFVWPEIFCSSRNGRYGYPRLMARRYRGLGSIWARPIPRIASRPRRPGR